MASITVEEIRARHKRLVSERERDQKAYQHKDAGYMFVLGELELMIEDLERRAAAELAAAELADAERSLLTLAEPEPEAGRLEC
jgi:hypothetical protein